MKGIKGGDKCGLNTVLALLFIEFIYYHCISQRQDGWLLDQFLVVAKNSCWCIAPEGTQNRLFLAKISPYLHKIASHLYLIADWGIAR